MNKVEVTNLCFSYESDKETLNNVSFSVEKGSYVSIIGHNGSGKSTLAKLLIGLLNAKSGTIKIDDLELNKANLNEIRRKTALVFQNPDNQFIGATVEDDIAFGLENRRIPHDGMKPIIDKFASLVGMSNFIGKEPSSLSGGQKQRVAIAGVLALNPELLIFDEATCMLDPKGKREILELVSKLKKENKDLTIISITHDMEEAYLSDKVIVLSQGRVVFDDKPLYLLNNDNMLKALNLTMPFMLETKKQLSERNYDVSNAQSIDDLVEIICQSK